MNTDRLQKTTFIIQSSRITSDESLSGPKSNSLTGHLVTGR